MSDENESAKESPRAEKPNFITKTKFDEFNLPADLLAGLDEAGFRYCTPIQAQSLPVSLEGKDIAGQAQTGTGKTAAFLVTTFVKLMKNIKNRKAGMPSALIIAPTRELALQVYEDARLLGKYTRLTTGLAIGGIDYRKQADDIRRGPDIVICTPGRIIDYLNQGIFKPQNIEVLVIDEADRLLDLGFIKDLRFLLRKMPHYEKRQTMLFSATLSYRVLELTYEYMNLPEFISVTPEDIAVDRVEQVLYHVGNEEKMSLLLGLFKKEDWSRVIIFVNTKAGVEWVAKKLVGNGLPAEGITGDLPQPKRLKLMERFKDDRLKILVATDVASRGIHVEDISHVINYDLPQDVENYVHRIGRTARAGKTGKAISFACEDYVFHLEPLEEMLGYSIPVAFLDDDILEDDKAGDVYINRRFRNGKPAPKRKRLEKEKKPPRPTKPRFPTSSRPGGIFGLAPASMHLVQLEEEPAIPENDESAGEDVRKKRRRRRRKKKSVVETQQPSAETHEKTRAFDAAESETVDVEKEQAAPVRKQIEIIKASEVKKKADMKRMEEESGEPHDVLSAAGPAAEKEAAEPEKSQETETEAIKTEKLELTSGENQETAGVEPEADEADQVPPEATTDITATQEAGPPPREKAVPGKPAVKTATKTRKPGAPLLTPYQSRYSAFRKAQDKLSEATSEPIVEAATEEICIGCAWDINDDVKLVDAKSGPAPKKGGSRRKK